MAKGNFWEHSPWASITFLAQRYGSGFSLQIIRSDNSMLKSDVLDLKAKI